MKKHTPHAPVELTAEIKRRGFGDRMQRALRLVLEGASYRYAAELAGLKSHQDVARAAKTIPGLEEAHLRAWRAAWEQLREPLPALWRHHFKRLDDAA